MSYDDWKTEAPEYDDSYMYEKEETMTATHELQATRDHLMNAARAFARAKDCAVHDRDFRALLDRREQETYDAISHIDDVLQYR